MTARCGRPAAPSAAASAGVSGRMPSRARASGTPWVMSSTVRSGTGGGRSAASRMSQRLAAQSK
eukprot:1541983-Alexandrium_andersonii.AAC.1